MTSPPSGYERTSRAARHTLRPPTGRHGALVTGRLRRRWLLLVRCTGRIVGATLGQCRAAASFVWGAAVIVGASGGGVVTVQVPLSPPSDDFLWAGYRDEMGLRLQGAAFR